jgi:hypothetical protein
MRVEATFCLMIVQRLRAFVFPTIGGQSEARVRHHRAKRD